MPFFYFFIYFNFLLTFLTHCEKNYYIFCLQVIDNNDRFNVCSTISYYNVKHIKDNIYEAEAKGNYFRLVTLKIVHQNNREFHPYDNAGTLDK